MAVIINDNIEDLPFYVPFESIERDENEDCNINKNQQEKDNAKRKRV